MRLIKPAILIVSLIVLATSIGGLLLDWHLSSLNSALWMLLLGLILLRSQHAEPGERAFAPPGIRLLGTVGVVLCGLVLVRGLFRSDAVALLTLPALTLLGYVLARSLKDRRDTETPAVGPSSR